MEDSHPHLLTRFSLVTLQECTKSVVFLLKIGDSQKRDC